MASGGPLYSARLADPRERAAQPRARSRGKTTRAEATSDVTRFRGVLAAAGVGAAATIAAALLAPPPGGGGAPGPLSLPHEKAGIACASCHRDRAPGAAAAPSPALACAGCHGAHPSLRRGHTAAIAGGTMTCATCHTIHIGDQGVRFSPDAAPVRYAPGAEREVAGVAFRPPRPATVAIPTAGSCKGCHALASPADPIARCLLAGQEALGDARPIVCFDEHRSALPPDDARGRGPRPSPGAAGVCAQNHGEDRAAAWEAAREAAAILPVLRGGGRGGAPWAWLGVGLFAAAITFAGVRAGHAIRARRRRIAAEPGVDAFLKPAVRVRLPQIDTTSCLGCYACVDACPYDVLEVERYVAVVARPEACCGLTLCEQRCPNGSLRITDGAPIGDRPRLDDDLQSLDVPGLYLAGDVTGVPLIKNAIHQGARAVERIAAGLGGASRGAEAKDLVIVGAGPAGISAALRAKELGLSFEVIEQGSAAQSIRSFPRGKLVFDQPLELPVAGKLWLRESTKEELLSQWMRVVRQERLPILEDTRMIAALRDASTGLFRVTTEPREGGAPVTRLARRVLLALGQRGSPRRLPFDLAPEVESLVHYHLADARSFEGKRVVVVGLGDVAMEAAIALSRQPSTTVIVTHRGDGFSRGKARNVAELRRLAEAGRVSLRFGTEVAGVEEGRVLLRGPAGEGAAACDAVLVMIGSIPPWEALRAAGVRTAAEVQGTGGTGHDGGPLHTPGQAPVHR